LTELVEAKMKGKEEIFETKVPEVEATQDLMEALKASIKVSAKG